MKKSIKMLSLSISLITLLMTPISTFAAESKLEATPTKSVAAEDYVSIAIGKDLNKLVEKTNEYKLNNPNASEDELKNFFIKELKKSPKTTKSSINNTATTNALLGINWYDLLPTLPEELNTYEQAIFNENPFYGSAVLVAAQEARDFSQSLFDSSYGWANDNADAFRHSYWNGLMVIGTTTDYATRFANAHENWGDNPAIDKEMDLYNNAEGRYRGLLVWQQHSFPTPILYHAALKDEIIRVLKIGNMKRYWGSDIGKLNYLVPSNGTGLLN